MQHNQCFYDLDFDQTDKIVSALRKKKNLDIFRQGESKNYSTFEVFTFHV